MKRVKFTKIAIAVILALLCVTVFCACDGLDDLNGISSLNYPNASAYTVAESGQVDSAQTPVSEIEVDWVNGNISIVADANVTSVEFREVADGAVTEDTTMHYCLENSILRIKFAKSGRIKINNLKKDLFIKVPLNCNLYEIDVENVNGTVDVNCNANKIETETVNGNVAVSATATSVSAESVNGTVDVNCNANKVEVENVNGNTAVKGRILELEVENVNGTVALELDLAVVKMDVETVSGNVTVSVPATKPFRLEYETVSGTLTSSLPSNLTQRGIHHYYLTDNILAGNGCEMSVETVSGRLVLQPLTA